MLLDISYKASISKSLADGCFSITEHFCLVPEALYQAENNDLWLNFGKERIANTQEIAVAHMAAQACYLLWEKGQEEKHIIGALLEIDCNDGVICALHDKQMAVIVLLHSKLQLANIYTVETKEDILYNLLNIYTQWQLNANTFSTYLIGANNDTIAFINEYISAQ